jgi:MFS family permease
MDLVCFNIYRVTGQLLPVYPIYVLLFQYKGLSLSSISLLLIIWSIPGLLLEVPSSILADRWNRRNLLVIGRTLKGFCFVIWGISDSFFGFAAGFLLWGTGGAFCSGTEEAWLYDCLGTNSQESEFDRIWGKSTFYSQLAVGVASAVGSLLATISMYLTIWLSVCFVLVSTLFAAALKEYNHQSITNSSHQWRNYLQTLQDGVRFCLTHKFVPLMIGFSVTVLVTAGVLDEYDQLIVRSMGVPLGLVGLWGFSRYGMEALGGRVAWRFKSLFIMLGITEPFPMQLYLAIVSGVMLLCAASYPILILLPIYGLYYFLMSCANVLFTDSLQQSIEHQGRATVQSLAAMLEAPGGMLIYAVFGVVGGFRHLQGAMMAVAIWILALCFLFWIAQRRKNKLI